MQRTRRGPGASSTFAASRGLRSPESCRSACNGKRAMIWAGGRDGFSLSVFVLLLMDTTSKMLHSQQLHWQSAAAVFVNSSLFFSLALSLSLSLSPTHDPPEGRPPPGARESVSPSLSLSRPITLSCLHWHLGHWHPFQASAMCHVRFETSASALKKSQNLASACLCWCAQHPTWLFPALSLQ